MLILVAILVIFITVLVVRITGIARRTIRRARSTISDVATEADISTLRIITSLFSIFFFFIYSVSKDT